MMWTYVVAYLDVEDIRTAPFIMVRSRKRGGWEMPGGRMEEGETPIGSAEREFLEETGRHLITDGDLSIPYKGGRVFFGITNKDAVQDPIEHEISDVSWFKKLPDDLAYPLEEYVPLIEMGRSMIEKKRP